MDIVLGILGIVAGIAVCVSGLRLFFIMLPIWGLVAGFFIGAAGVSAIAGDGFLATTLGIVVGIVVALVCSALAYLYWYVGVILAAGSAGSVLGAALFASFGVDSGWALFFIGVITGALFILGALIADLPVVLVAINTAIAGSAIAIGGVLLVFDQIDRAEIGQSAVWERINDNWFLWIVWLVGAALGFGAQMRDARSVALPGERWSPARETPRGSAAQTA